MTPPPAPASPLSGRHVIVLGDREGIPGPAIAACAASAGAQVVFSATTFYVCAAAGAMDLEHQRVILDLASRAAPGALLVVLGQADAVGVDTYARTVRTGDPAHTGALAGQALGLEVVHALDPDFKGQVAPRHWAVHVGMYEALLDAEPLVELARGGFVRA